jgi:hypothetical protein
VGRYQAWLCAGSTATSPAGRSTHATVPYRRTDGALIANDWADLTDGNIANPINRTESGADVSGTAPFLPWTFVTAAGTCDDETFPFNPFGPCDDLEPCKSYCPSDNNSGPWMSSSSFTQGSKGDINATDSTWTDGVTGSCSGQGRIYCIEQ